MSDSVMLTLVPWLKPFNGIWNIFGGMELQTTEVMKYIYLSEISF